MLEVLDLPYGVPRKDVFRRDLSALNPTAIQSCFAARLDALRQRCIMTEKFSPQKVEMQEGFAILLRLQPAHQGFSDARWVPTGGKMPKNHQMLDRGKRSGCNEC